MQTTRKLLAGLFIGTQACAPALTVAPTPQPLPPSPWSGPAVNRSDVPSVYMAQWEKAANRQTCAPFAFASLGKGVAAVPRSATFSGGWAVAYDLPQLRSAFGIAGSGSRASDPTYGGWPNHIEWADGSTADYGLEGGTGPNQLAYLRIAGQDCLYNVWSRISREHLEQLFESIRRIK